MAVEDRVGKSMRAHEGRRSRNRAENQSGHTLPTRVGETWLIFFQIGACP